MLRNAERRMEKAAEATPMEANKFSLAWRWVLVNAIGIAAYLLLEGSILASRSEGESLNGIDQIYFWFTRMLPVLVVVGVVDVIWAARIFRGSSPLRKWGFGWWLIVCFAWCVALVYNGFAIKIALVVFAVVYKLVAS